MMRGVRRTEGMRRLAASRRTVDSLTWRTSASCFAVRNSSRSGMARFRTGSGSGRILPLNMDQITVVLCFFSGCLCEEVATAPGSETVDLFWIGLERQGYVVDGRTFDF